MAAPAQTKAWSLTSNQDIILGICIIGILMVLVIPVPTWLLDILLTLSISISVVVLLATIYLQRAVEFAVFPSLLLMLTLFRLSLNVASTRLILSQADAGRVIDAFGTFVTRGSPVVGMVIFVILVVIQFVVITRGAGRISEVAARFTLDAMPGKQMGVDADLNAGLITEEQARTRRRDIEREADFYGAMDGATKFVRGDAIAGIIITIVNILGGLIIGMLMLGMPLAEAATVYVRLTIGDGLVSQVPALILSTAAGLIVTRTTTETNLGADLSRQLGRYPRALGVASALLAGFGLVPGLPTLPFMVTAAAFGFLAYQSRQRINLEREQAAARQRAKEEAQAAATPAASHRAEDLLNIDTLKVELGYGLIALADPKQGGDLLNRIQIIRQQMAGKMGFIVPVVRIVDNMRLRPNEYRVMLRESEIARYELMADHYLAMNAGLAEENIEGHPTKEPAFGLDAVWVPRSHRERAERAGYTVVEPSAVLATHLTEIIMDHADELLTREDVQSLINHVKERSPSVVNELLPGIITVGELQKVLHNLLRERVSIRNLPTILEVLADYGPRTKDVDILTEYVRHALARTICSAYADENRHLRVVTLSPKLESEILEAVRKADTAEFVPLDPNRADAIAANTAKAIQPLTLSGQEPVVLTSAPIRRFFKRIVARQLPRLAVISYNEVDPRVELIGEGQVSA